MSETTTGAQADREFVGYGPAAEYLGLRANTLSGYVTDGLGPDVHERRVVRQYVRPVFLKSELDRWSGERPGRGARTDLRLPKSEDEVTAPVATSQ